MSSLNRSLFHCQQVTLGEIDKIESDNIPSIKHQLLMNLQLA